MAPFCSAVDIGVFAMTALVLVNKLDSPWNWIGAVGAIVIGVILARLVYKMYDSKRSLTIREFEKKVST